MSLHVAYHPIGGVGDRTTAVVKARREAGRERSPHTTPRSGGWDHAHHDVSLSLRRRAAPARYARRESQLDLHELYLRRHRAAGCRNGLQLWREIRERGYPGSSRVVSRWAQERRTEPALSTPRRHLTGEGSAAPAPAAAQRPPGPKLA